MGTALQSNSDEMAHRKRVSISSTRSVSPMVLSANYSPNPDAEEWVKTWEQVEAKGMWAPLHHVRHLHALMCVLIYRTH